jgi:hypothetical protein
MVDVYVPKNVWVEWHDLNEPEARDVIVQMEDDTMYTALYVTFGYLERQMILTHELSRQVPDAPPVYHAVLDTPHVIVPNLERDTIEDSIDNLLALETFESVFTLVTEKPEEDQPEQQPQQQTTHTKRATQEIAAVVVSEVLLMEPNTVA